MAAWRRDAVAALAGALEPGDNPIERAKAERLRRHLFAGPPSEGLARLAGTASRRADRLRADLADLVTCGAGLYLFSEPG